MKRLFQLVVAFLVLASVLAPQATWASRNKHYVQHHKVRHVKRHHAHRAGA